MNYTTQVGNPTAHITKKKSRLKIYNGNTVFLNDRDNFEFEINNPTNKTILCKIKLNGNYISASGIILKPGQKVYLERFLDSNNKFEFSTYQVKDTAENKAAIDLNGDVAIEFYNEQEIVTYNTPSIVFGGWNNTANPYYNGVTHTTNIGSTLTTSSASSNAFYSSVAINDTNTTFSFNNSSTLGKVRAKKSIETGRVEKGEQSDQKFTNYYGTFNHTAFHNINFKILPLSTKNKTTEDIRQYCNECGTKIKKNHNFCPSCGNDLNKKKETAIKYTDNLFEIINEKRYQMVSYNMSLPELIEKNIGKTIIIHKPSLSEKYLRAIIF